MKKTLPSLLLIALVCLAYGSTIQHPFYFDDIPSILEKPWIRGLDKIPDFIFSLSQRPLVILSFNINYAISEFEVWSYHIFNITLHLLAVFLVYRLGKLILSCMTQSDPTITDVLNKMPLLAASIFALHPLNTQAVTYISSRSSIMVTIFYLVTILLFFKGLNKKNDKKIKLNYVCLIGSVLSFVFGLLCKLVIVSLPAALFACHYYFMSRQSMKTWWHQHWRSISIIGGLLILAISYKEFYGGGILHASAAVIHPLDYFRTQIAVIPFEYFRKMIFPFNLTIDPGFQLIIQWSSFLVISGILILGIFIIMWLKLSGINDRHKTYGPEAFGLIWILITLSPTSSIVPVLDPSSEHRTYLPLIGFSIALSSILVRLNYFLQYSDQRRFIDRYKNRKESIITAVCIFLVLVSFLIGTRERNKAWKDEVSLWTDAKLKAPFHPRPYSNLGEAYDKLGDYDRAIKEFEAALSLNPRYFYALSNLGNIYGKKKEYAKAIGYIEKALKEKPKSKPAHLLGKYAPAQYNLAKALHITGHPKKAAESYRLAVKYKSYFEEAIFNLGFISLELKNFIEAVENFKKFIELQPKNPKAHFGLGTAYSMMGKQEDARKHYENAINFDPKFLSPYISLANLDMAIGKTKEAKILLTEVLLKDPTFAGAHKNLGIIFLRENDFNNASKHLNEYLRLVPLAPDALAIKSILQNKTGNKLH